MRENTIDHKLDGITEPSVSKAVQDSHDATSRTSDIKGYDRRMPQLDPIVCSRRQLLMGNFAGDLNAVDLNFQISTLCPVS